jgi:hypothetical protein
MLTISARLPLDIILGVMPGEAIRLQIHLVQQMTRKAQLAYDPFSRGDGQIKQRLGRSKSDYVSATRQPMKTISSAATYTTWAIAVSVSYNLPASAPCASTCSRLIITHVDHDICLEP